MRSQWSTTKPQQQKKTQKIFKQMETEQYAAKRPLSNQRNKGRNQKVLRIQ
jgi:hypothetical protein